MAQVTGRSQTMITWNEAGIALGLFLFFEGLLPLLAPARLRAAMQQLLAFTDGQLRFAGLMAMGAGWLVLYFMTRSAA